MNLADPGFEYTGIGFGASSAAVAKPVALPVCDIATVAVTGDGTSVAIKLLPCVSVDPSEASNHQFTLSFALADAKKFGQAIVNLVNLIQAA